jgi:ATP-dependent Lon protease
MAAFRTGINTVIIPEANVPDLDDIDKAVLGAIRFVPVKHVEEVLEIVLEKPAKPKPKPKKPAVTLDYEQIPEPAVTLLT